MNPPPLHPLPRPLAGTDWLADRLGAPGLVVLDASVGAHRGAARRIPGARPFDIDGPLSDPASPLPHTMPDAARFTRELRALGVNDADTVVVYDAVGIYSSARAWWMLRAMGFDRATVLDGGLPAWEAAGLPAEEAARPVGEAARPVGEAVRPVGDGAWPVGAAVRPVAAAVRQGAEAARSRGQAARPGGEAVRPGEDGAWPVGAAVRLAVGAVRQGAEAARSGGQAARPGAEAARPVGEAVRPGGDGAWPVGAAVRPVAEAVRQGAEAARSGGQAARPGGDAVRPVGAAVRQGAEAARSGGQAVRPGGGGARPGGDAVRPGEDGAPAGEDAGPSAAGRLGDFTARARAGLLVGADEVARALADPDAVVLDARARDRFTGAAPEPRPGLRGGHMPGAANLPFGDLQRDGRMRPRAELRELFEAAAGGRERLVVSCGSGVTACVLALGAELAGYGDLAVYDGSWSEWGLPSGGRPVVTGGA
ncbi:rhodanese-like domain-containing protein [Streptomyces coeruleoprunus]|uniref:Rhodanese-like domain-containing protein n=1 Tax=Streptomyces coeruleoprunus TaxID=285563 RepID=A0ABV9XJA6_9ACTN